jgi:hypothetical protein
MHSTQKRTPMFVAVERGGQIRRRVVANVTGATLRVAIRESVDSKAKSMTGKNNAYHGPSFATTAVVTP